MDHVTWYTTRATGITAYLLLFVTVALGMLLSGPGGAWWKGMPVLALHRFTTWLMGGFLAVHVLVLLFDQFLRFNLLQILVPFVAIYETFWTGVGVLAMYLLVLVVVSTVIRKKLQNTVWYGLHLLSYPAFVGATAHGIMAGSDTGTSWMQVLYVVCGALAAILLALRFTKLSKDAGQAQRWAPGVVAGGIFGAMVLVLISTRLH